jgi:hypothetical protein
MVKGTRRAHRRRGVERLEPIHWRAADHGAARAVVHAGPLGTNDESASCDDADEFVDVTQIENDDVWEPAVGATPTLVCDNCAQSFAIDLTAIVRRTIETPEGDREELTFCGPDCAIEYEKKSGRPRT